MKTPWPGANDPIEEVTYELVVGFDNSGAPVFKRGRTRDPETLRSLQMLLEPLERSPASITSETMGRVELALRSGAQVTLRPVFHPTPPAYKDLLKVDRDDVLMPPALASLLNRWRAELGLV